MRGGVCDRIIHHLPMDRCAHGVEAARTGERRDARRIAEFRGPSRGLPVFFAHGPAPAATQRCAQRPVSRGGRSRLARRVRPRIARVGVVQVRHPASMPALCCGRSARCADAGRRARAPYGSRPAQGRCGDGAPRQRAGGRTGVGEPAGRRYGRDPTASERVRWGREATAPAAVAAAGRPRHSSRTAVRVAPGGQGPCPAARMPAPAERLRSGDFAGPQRRIVNLLKNK